jgi:hypothetical protein
LKAKAAYLKRSYLPALRKDATAHLTIGQMEEEMWDIVYEKLQEYLDALPVGFSKTKSGD